MLLWLLLYVFSCCYDIERKLFEGRHCCQGKDNYQKKFKLTECEVELHTGSYSQVFMQRY